MITPNGGVNPAGEHFRELRCNAPFVTFGARCGRSVCSSNAAGSVALAAGRLGLALDGRRLLGPPAALSGLNPGGRQKPSRVVRGCLFPVWPTASRVLPADKRKRLHPPRAFPGPVPPPTPARGSSCILLIARAGHGSVRGRRRALPDGPARSTSNTRPRMRAVVSFSPPRLTGAEPPVQRETGYPGQS